MAVRRVRVGEGERHSKHDDICKILKIAVAVPTLRAGICDSASSRLAVSMRVRLKKVGQYCPFLDIVYILCNCCRVLPFGGLHLFKVWPTW